MYHDSVKAGAPDGPDERFVTAEHVVSAQQGDATVLLDVRGGTYYTLNGVGGRIWGLLSEGSSVATVAERLSAEYAVSEEQARGDVEAFVDSLAQSRLIRSR